MPEPEVTTPPAPELTGLAEEELAELRAELHRFDTHNISPPEAEPRGKMGYFAPSSFWHRLLASVSRVKALEVQHAYDVARNFHAENQTLQAEYEGRIFAERRVRELEGELASVRASMLRFSDQQDEGQTTAELLRAVELEADCEHERATVAERERDELRAEVERLRAELASRPQRLLRPAVAVGPLDLSDPATAAKLARGATIARGLREPCTVHNDANGVCIKCGRQIRKGP